MNATGCPGGLLDAVSGNELADPVDPLAVRQRGRWAPGIAAALKVSEPERRARDRARAATGGTTDIGFGCLSGMFERNDDVLYICYDNGPT